MPAATVVVIGSLNIDYIASVERLPRAGQTIAATQLIWRFGGKGANQAVAAARQDAQVSLIGCVGIGNEGEAYRERLRAEGIHTEGLATTGQALTGTALIAVERSAENLIIVAAGANAHLSPALVRKQRAQIRAADILLLQFEIPLPSVVEAIRLANHAQVPVVLNPSPLRKEFPWGIVKIHTLIANAGEAEAILRRKVAGLPRQLASWQQALRRLRVECLLITQGPRPTLCITHTNLSAIPTLRVKPLDTVGAGDAFAGTFAARLAGGDELIRAIRCANCAGALATLKAGAQESMPRRRAVDRVLKSLV